MKRVLFGLCLGLAACQDSGGSAADGAPPLPDAAPGPPAAAPDTPDAASGDDGEARREVLEVMERVADWQIQELEGNSSSSWEEATFYAGLVATYWNATPIILKGVAFVICFFVIYILFNVAGWLLHCFAKI